jgi:periplasmic copper chaperone A
VNIAFKNSAILTFVFLLLAGTVSAHSYKLADIQIGHIWARATAPNATTASVYVPFLNNGKTEDQLIGGNTIIAVSVELHESYEENGVAKMRKLTFLSIVPQKPVAMRPRGKHIMLIGLKRQLKDGDKFPLTLKFAKAGNIELEVFVHTATAPMQHHQ